MLEIAGKRALVTGAGIRVGRAIADALIDAGVQVAFHHHGSAEGAEEGVARALAQGAKAVALKTDLLDDAAAAQLPAVAARMLGGLDLLVNSAAAFERLPFEQISPLQLDRMLGLNFRAPFLLAQAAAPLLRGARGAIFNILDVAAERPWVGYAHYCASKSALHMLTRALAKELAPEIRVNGIEPGIVLFPESEPAAQRQASLTRVPLGREGRPADVAEALLALWRNAYVTGAILAVDGGVSL